MAPVEAQTNHQPDFTMQSLIDQMPETDKELQTRKDATDPARQQSKEKAKPDRWGEASKFSGPEPSAVNPLFEQAIARGREGFVELIRLVRDPAAPDFKNYKAEYFLHGLAMRVSAPGREAQRKLLAETMAGEISAAQGEVRAFLIRELRLMGGVEAVSALGKALADETLCADAAAALVSIGEKGAEPLRDALQAANGKSRAIVLQALGELRDKKSLPAFTSSLSAAEMDTRLIAAWALARIGDPASVAPLLKLADTKSTWERAKATQSCLVLAETLTRGGKRSAAAKVYEHLRSTRTDPSEAYVREIATRALGAPPVG